MVKAILRRKKILNKQLKFAGSKSGKILNYIITGLGVKVPGKVVSADLYNQIANHADEAINVDIDNRKDKNIFNYPKFKQVEVKDKADGISLEEWFRGLHDDEELREAFINMDLAMKFVHENKNSCVKSFNPKDIRILNNSLRQIKFNTLLKMPKDDYDRKELVKEDIYSSAFLQIAAYMNNVSTNSYNDHSITDFLANMKPDFLRQNFDSFTTFIPEKDVPYYRGVVQRGASVYFSEFVKEQKKRDLMALEKEIDGGMGQSSSNTASRSKESGKSLVKSNGHWSGDSLIDDNSAINSRIYGGIENMDIAAFTKAYVLPIIMIIMGIALMIGAYILSN
ncbi:MAG: hypothetical protein IJ880_12220 [Bacilli bacterium]|nr:hypothetical protein [Bacilli bacterium]